MSVLSVKDARSCRWDAASLGEVMLRLDPGEGRIRTARSFTVWEGGGEYNVVRALRRVFGWRSTTVTAIPDNDLGMLLEERMLAGGVDLSHSLHLPADPIGRANRVGLNFTERGFGIRGALGISDRAWSATAGMRAGQVNWERLFGEEGVRWFHTGGIFAALSQSTPEVAKEAMQAARRHGTIVSYDLNYRASLWNANGGLERAQEVNRDLARYVDVMIGNEEDFTACLGYEVEGVDPALTKLDPTGFQSMIARAVGDYPNFAVVATTLRAVQTATRNDWSAVLWQGGEFHRAPVWPDLEIMDRVGGGDGFASGMIHGFLEGHSGAEAVGWGAAHGALAMTTPGDTSMASRAEVEKLLKGGSARVVR